MKRRRLFRIFLYTLLILGILALCLLDTVDWTPYQQMPYYSQTKAEIERFTPVVSRGDTLRAGWAAGSIVPAAPVDLAGYGRRGKYESVHDSLWVRCLVFESGGRKAAIISFDLLIVPPSVANTVRRKLKEQEIDYTYFSASHTHSGFGGWVEETGGSLIIGSYDEKNVGFLVERAMQTALSAKSRLEPAVLSFQKLDAGAYVRNRLDDKGNVDPWLRVVQVRTASGKTGLLTSFSAHATILSSKIKQLSGDYPGVLVSELEKSPQVDFAMFCMGATASHRPEVKASDFANVARYGKSLSDTILKYLPSARPDSVSSLAFGVLPVHLREPHLRISGGIRVRPWVFRQLFGEISPAISYLRVGSQLFLGMPCDFSGELYPEFEKIAESKKRNLSITSFNGAYIGYVTNDRYYHLPRGETRDMNWFGPYNSAYFTEIVSGLLRKAE